MKSQHSSPKILNRHVTLVQLSGYDVGSWPADFTCRVTNLWLTGDQFVGKLSANQANSAFQLSGVGKRVVIHMFAFVETIKHGRLGLRVDVWLQVTVRE